MKIILSHHDQQGNENTNQWLDGQQGTDFAAGQICEAIAKKKTIVLAGNPNVGKSLIFNGLTGLHDDISNYPETTLAMAYGQYHGRDVADTPGIYGLASFTELEQTATACILSAGLVINVVDAVHLERDLFLSQQIIDCGIPMIMVLNMIDDAKAQGLCINGQRLAQLMGVPVIKTNATTGYGMTQLKQAIDQHSGTIGNPTSDQLRDMLVGTQSQVAITGEGVLLLEGDHVIAKRYGVPSGDQRDFIYGQRRQKVTAIVDQVVTEQTQGMSFATRLSRWMIQPRTGFPILILVLTMMYLFIGVFVAQTVVDYTEAYLMGQIYTPWIQGLVGRGINLDSWLGYILVGEFGLLTMAVTYIFGLLLPLVLGFYLALSILEDSGYLPRLAILTDRMMMSVGLNGRAIIPFILGFGCITLATVVTRMLSTDRERFITIFLLSLAVPCSAQLGVITGVLARMGGWYVVTFVVVICCIMAIGGTLLNYLIPGKSSDLLMALPPLRLPHWRNVWYKMSHKSIEFIVEAVPIFACGTLVISLCKLTGLLDFFQRMLNPMVVGWLSLPEETTTSFIMGLIRRDFGAAGLSSLPLQPMEMTIALIVIILYVPCMATTLVMIKERGKQQTALIWLFSLVIAFGVGGLVNQLVRCFTNQSLGLMVVCVAFILATLAIGRLCRKGVVK